VQLDVVEAAQRLVGDAAPYRSLSMPVMAGESEISRSEGQAAIAGVVSRSGGSLSPVAEAQVLDAAAAFKDNTSHLRQEYWELDNTSPTRKIS